MKAAFFWQTHEIMAQISSAIDTDAQTRGSLLRSLHLLNASTDPEFDELVELATTICGKPLGAMTLLDEDTQLMKARVGLKGAPTMPVRDSICQHTVRGDRLMMVEDVGADPRFQTPVIQEELGVRFYAGVPLRSESGCALGALCVMDLQPATLSAGQQRALEILGHQVSKHIQMRERALALAIAASELQKTRDELQVANEKLHSLSMTDALTGLWNRRAFDSQLEMAVIAAQRSGLPIALMLIDADNFKSINDRYGHPYGDTVLRNIAAVLNRVTRAEEIACRFGGEEFAVLMPGHHADAAAVLAERVLASMSLFPWEHGPVTASIGLAMCSKGCSSDDLLDHADAALYRAKRQGRNRVVMYRPES